MDLYRPETLINTWTQVVASCNKTFKKILKNAVAGRSIGFCVSNGVGRIIPIRN